MTLTALVLAGLITAPAAASDERLRTILPNNAIIWAERFPQAKSVSVQLFVATTGVDVSSQPRGVVHLLEHLLLKPARLNDAEFAPLGVFSSGKSYRDFLQVEVSASPERLDEALQVLKRAIQPLSASAEQVRFEAKLIQHEIDAVSDDALLGRKAWTSAYGLDAADPLGEPEALAETDPSALASLATSLFIGRNLVVSITGPINVDDATRRATDLLSSFPKGERPSPPARSAAPPGRWELPGSFGEARAASVGAYRDVSTAAALAAGLAIASQMPSAFVSYTPSLSNGLVVIGQTERAEGLGLFVDDMEDATKAQLFSIGKLLARRWLNGYLETPSGSGFIRGMLYSQGASNRPEYLAEALDVVNWQDFQEALNRFTRERAYVVVGS